MEVIFLVSSVSGDMATKSRMDNVERLFAAKSISATIVDAAIATNRDRREALFKSSGIRGVFPQIFIHNPINQSDAFISVDEVSTGRVVILIYSLFRSQVYREWHSPPPPLKFDIATVDRSERGQCNNWCVNCSHNSLNVRFGTAC